MAAALIGAPAVLVTAATAYLAGHAQARAAHHGPVDSVRRTAQRDAYSDLVPRTTSTPAGRP